jgi:ribosome-binding factor A
MVSKLRGQKIADRIRQDLSEILLFEISDPRLNGVNVTDITVDRELTIADVYVSAIEGSIRSEEILAGLNHARGFLRRQLAARVKLRTFPQLRFHWDPTPEKADHMEKLFARLREEQDTPSKADDQTKDEE